MKKYTDYIVAVAGLLLFAAGIVLLKTITDPQGIIRVLPFVCIGVGCGAFGHGMGNIIGRRQYKKRPDMQKRINIERSDERNIAVERRAKAKAYDIMVFAYSVLLLAFALMDVDLTVLLLLVFAYLFVIGTDIYYRTKYNKEM